MVEKCLKSHHRSCWDFDYQSALMLLQLLLGRWELRQVDASSYVKKNTTVSAQLHTLQEVSCDCSQDVLCTLSEVSFLRKYVHVCSHCLIQDPYRIKFYFEVCVHVLQRPIFCCKVGSHITSHNTYTDLLSI